MSHFTKNKILTLVLTALCAGQSMFADVIGDIKQATSAIAADLQGLTKHEEQAYSTFEYIELLTGAGKFVVNPVARHLKHVNASAANGAELLADLVSLTNAFAAYQNSDERIWDRNVAGKPVPLNYKTFGALIDCGDALMRVLSIAKGAEAHADAQAKKNSGKANQRTRNIQQANAKTVGGLLYIIDTILLPACEAGASVVGAQQNAHGECVRANTAQALELLSKQLSKCIASHDCPTALVTWSVLSLANIASIGYDIGWREIAKDGSVPTEFKKALKAFSEHGAKNKLRYLAKHANLNTIALHNNHWKKPCSPLELVIVDQHLSASKKVELIKFLVARGADVNATTVNGEKPLVTATMHALKTGDNSVAQALLDLGACPNVTMLDKDNQTTSLYSVLTTNDPSRASYPDHAFLQCYCPAGKVEQAELTNRAKALVDVFKTKDAKAYAELGQEIINKIPNDDLKKLEQHTKDALVKLITDTLNDGTLRADYKFTHDGANKPLARIAIELDDTQLLELCCQKGFNPTNNDLELIWALALNRPDCALLLLEKGCSATQLVAPQGSQALQSTLIWADRITDQAKRGAVKAKLTEKGAKGLHDTQTAAQQIWTNDTTPEKTTALNELAAQVKSGALPISITIDTNTAGHYAATHTTLYQLACQYLHTELMLAVLTKNPRGMNIANFILAHVRNNTDEKKAKAIALLKAVLKAGLGVDVNQPAWVKPSQYTDYQPDLPALHLAIEDDNTELVTLLLEHGACPNIAGTHVTHNNADIQHNNFNTGITALHMAAVYGSPEMVTLMLENGADKDVKNAADKTALELAEHKDKNNLYWRAYGHDNIPADDKDAIEKREKIISLLK
ncbi:MAG: ankyrin repeat domain-containing protein [Epsilonproteobacteria bacterium]|nr:ankyrin repeat domain-containing protein [Campylobacterota bacterium]